MLIFHHISKTAGTSLRTILKKNYQPHELFELYGANRGSIDWYRRFYDSLSTTQKSSIKCIAAHTAHFIIPILEQPFQVFCLLRDPVDRVISLYYFALFVADTDQGRSGQIGKTLKRLNWKIEDIYLNFGDGDETLSEQHQWFRLFFNGQARTILAPHVSTQRFRYLSEQSDYGFYEDKLQDILQNYYIVGIQECFQESIECFAHKFGWKNLGNVVENVTQTRPKVGELSQEVIALIRAYNDLDVKLHNAYLKQYV